MEQVNKTATFNPAEWKWPEEGDKDGWTRQKRREYIKYMSESIGLAHVSKVQLAQKFNCDRGTVYNDINALYKAGVDPSEVRRASVDFTGVNKGMLKQLSKDFVEAKTPKLRADIAKAILDVQQGQTDILEKFGIKEPIATTTDSEIVVRFGKAPGKK